MVKFKAELKFRRFLRSRRQCTPMGILVSELTNFCPSLASLSQAVPSVLYLCTRRDAVTTYYMIILEVEA